MLNIQASWLTVGKVAQLCLHGGANDFGSIMIEENVVSAAGAPHRFTSRSIQDAIREARVRTTASQPAVRMEGNACRHCRAGDRLLTFLNMRTIAPKTPAPVSPGRYRGRDILLVLLLVAMP